MQSRLDQGQRLLHFLGMGLVDGLQEDGRSGRGPREDLRAGAVLCEVDEGAPDGHDAAEGQGGEVQADAEPIRFVAREVFVVNRSVCCGCIATFTYRNLLLI